MAEGAGLDAAVVAEARVELVGLLFSANPRRERTVELIRRVRDANESMIRSGVTDRIPRLSERFGLGRTRIYEILQQSGDTADGFEVQSTASES